MKAEITFIVGEQPRTLSFHHAAGGNPWRFLADETAIVLVPLCDSLARPVKATPLFDSLEIRPCRWGCPDFAKTNPAEYAELRRRFFAGEFPPDDIPLPSPDQLEQYWPSFFEQCGNQVLWEKCANDGMKRDWINGFEEFTGLGFWLCCLAQQNPHELRGPEPTVLVKDLERIRYHATFANGEKREIILLAECTTDLLTPDEQHLSPQFLGREQERLHKQMELETAKERNVAQWMAVAEKLTAAAKEVAKATEIADLFANKSVADAKDAAVTRGVPKEFITYCLTERYARKFPSIDQSLKAVQIQPMFRALRDPQAPSRATVGRWHHIVRKELEKRGLLQPRPKYPRSYKAANYDLERHPAPSLDEAEHEQEQGRKTGPDTRAQELGDTQS